MGKLDSEFRPHAKFGYVRRMQICVAGLLPLDRLEDRYRYVNISLRIFAFIEYSED